MRVPTKSLGCQQYIAHPKQARPVRCLAILFWHIPIGVAYTFSMFCSRNAYLHMGCVPKYALCTPLCIYTPASVTWSNFEVQTLRPRWYKRHRNALCGNTLMSCMCRYAKPPVPQAVMWLRGNTHQRAKLTNTNMACWHTISRKPHLPPQHVASTCTTGAEFTTIWVRVNDVRAIDDELV